MFAPNNVQDEERVSARLFRLVRAGRVQDAQQLCLDTGQAWRAGVLGAHPLGNPLGNPPASGLDQQGALH